MAGKKGAEEKRPGFKQVIAVTNFFKFEKPGDEFQGTFLESGERTSKKYSNVQTVWTCADRDGVITLISEKATMAAFRHLLKKGDEFILIFTGEKDSSGGKRPYKEFDFFIRD